MLTSLQGKPGGRIYLSRFFMKFPRLFCISTTRTKLIFMWRTRLFCSHATGCLPCSFEYLTVIFLITFVIKLSFCPPFVCMEEQLSLILLNLCSFCMYGGTNMLLCQLAKQCLLYDNYLSSNEFPYFTKKKKREGLILGWFSLFRKSKYDGLWFLFHM